MFKPTVAFLREFSQLELTQSILVKSLNDRLFGLLDCLDRRSLLLRLEWTQRTKRDKKVARLKKLNENGFVLLRDEWKNSRLKRYFDHVRVCACVCVCVRVCASECECVCK